MTEKADISVTIDDVLEDEDAVCLEAVDVADLVVASHPLALVLHLRCVLFFAPCHFLSSLSVLLHIPFLLCNLSTLVFQ